MSKETISIATITLTIIGDGGTLLDKFLEQIDHYKANANFKKHCVDVTYSDSLVQLQQ